MLVVDQENVLIEGQFTSFIVFMWLFSLGDIRFQPMTLISVHETSFIQIRINHVNFHYSKCDLTALVIMGKLTFCVAISIQIQEL